MICHRHFSLLLCCLLVACALLLQAEAEPQPSAHPNSKNLENPLAENWNQAAGGHLSDLLFKLRRRRRDTAAVAEEIQKCIQNQMAVTDNSGVPPSTPPPSEDDYSKCDMVVDCCQIINTDHEESDRVDCDCKKLLKN